MLQRERLKPYWRLFTAAVVTAVLVQPATAAVAAPAGPGRPQPAAAPAGTPPAEVGAGERTEVLGAGWQTSADRMWTTSGDAAGFHVLVAEQSTGYQWRTAATLKVQGLETDAWIGNACVTSSGDRAVVVFAPRTYTNREDLAARGGFTAVVDLRSGVVTRLALRTSLAYFNPGCGVGEQVTLTQEGDLDLGRTRVYVLDAATGKLAEPVDVDGQLTSAIPTKNGLVGADKNRLVSVGKDGKRREIAPATGVPYQLSTDAGGGVVFLEHAASQARARRVSVAAGRYTSTDLAAGKVDELSLARSADGRVFITGSPEQVSSLPSMVARVDAPVDTVMSTRGEAAVTRVRRADGADPRYAPADVDAPVGVTIDATSVKTKRTMHFRVDPGDRTAPRSTVDTGYYCAVQRNDPDLMVYQPRPYQVEWAVNMMVKRHMEVTRPANWHNNGLPAYDPQAMFPQVDLVNNTSARVPAQIMLGILGQESNLWMASHALPGEYGNPLVGNFYGNDEAAASSTAWHITWSKADCGYGISQMTDGMRLVGHEKDGETALPATTQRAVATDYIANIAAGLQLLQGKWNQLQNAGLKLNNNDPSVIENWFFAAWAYNAGYHELGEPDTNGAFGLGWGNNPANPRYPAGRGRFGEYPEDFAKPGQYPYPEKILGFATYTPSIAETPTKESPMFRPATWNGADGDVNTVGTANYNRAQAVPKPQQFCSVENNCEWGASYLPTYPGNGTQGTNVIGEPAGPCAHVATTGQYDLKCWWHSAATYRTDCATSCGHEFIRFDYPAYKAEQADGVSYPPVCTSPLPAGMMIIDDMPDSYSPRRISNCEPANAGTFSLTFNKDTDGSEVSKIDLHQLDGGYGGHFWFGHDRSADPRMTITGTWAFNTAVNGWARVFVHLPDHGAQTRQAKYVINLGNGTRFRIRPQRIGVNQWVSLGVFPFAGEPSITLSTESHDGVGEEDVAWDAAAVLPTSKPKQFIAALGDSYSSGEGVSETTGTDYYHETDVDGKGPFRDACHRSRYAWSRQMTLADSGTQVGTRSDAMTSDIDYNMVACSGARTHNILPYTFTNALGKASEKEYGEVPQLESGYVDVDTTLVTLSIGGNDSRFSDVLKHCIYGTLSVCQTATLDGDSAPLSEAEPALIQGGVRSSIEMVLRQIHYKAPNAKILLMGYPQLFEAPAACVPGIGGGEYPWLNDVGAVLNATMQDAANTVMAEGIQAHFADPQAAFKGKAVCGDPEDVHGFVLTLTPGDDPAKEIWPGKGVVSAQGFHPKLAGAAIYAGVATNTLREMGL